jgi:hypothetical protein
MDRLLRWIRDIKQATFFDIQNVADYYLAHKAEDEWNTGRDFTVAPPFDFFATRYTLTDYFGPEYSGLEILSVFRVVARPPDAPLADVIADGVELNPYRAALVAEARWHLLVQVFSVEGRVVTPPVDYFLAVDPRGQIATHRGHIALWLTDTHTLPGVVGLVADTFLQISLLALTFLNCRNVEVVKPPPATKKRLPRKLKFESRYHKIKVNAIGRRREQPACRRGPTGISQALHIVRGHFREYGPDYDKGLLFGKYAGRFWVASHFKGDLAAGVVAKDYEVLAPGEG